MWAHAAEDPAYSATGWLYHGAPAGISEKLELPRVLEPVAGETPNDPDDLESDLDCFSNYRGVEDCPEALAIIQTYVNRGWLKEFDVDSGVAR